MVLEDRGSGSKSSAGGSRGIRFLEVQEETTGSGGGVGNKTNRRGSEVQKIDVI